MTRQAIQMIALVILALSMAACSGCGKPPAFDELDNPEIEKPRDSNDGGGTKEKIDIEGDTSSATRSTTDPRPVPQELMRTIYFDYDNAGIRPDQRVALEGNAKYMQENPAVKILVEGHCDERGTLEYNMALGTRRAEGVIEFLVSRGVSKDRLLGGTRGEESPAVEGTGEAVWTKNRRAEFYFID